MAAANLIILYVENCGKSTAFYRDLLEREPDVAAPGFASFTLADGMSLGLWTRANVQPPAASGGAEGEIAFMVKTPAEIEARLADWTGRGLPIAQPLTTMDFGPTFVALDPDGHRLRVCLFDA